VTERSKVVIVYLDHEVRTDDFEDGLAKVLGGIKGVAEVELAVGDLGPDVMALQSAKVEVRQSVIEALFGADGVLKFP
jgi:hypothetical protein